jgi:prepilin-type N-terminal cleavage/methylation domain-containing protein
MQSLVDRSAADAASRRTVVARGFTLIELLAAMAILSLVVIMMAAIFSESDKAWNHGTGRAINSTEGRAALSMIVHDLETAVADEMLTFMMRPDKNGSTIATYGFTNSEINLVSLQNDSADGNRTARQIQYYLTADTQPYGTRYQLKRRSEGPAVGNTNNCYWSPTWFEDRRGNAADGIMADNVVALAFRVPLPGGMGPGGAYRDDYWFAGGSSFSNLTASYIQMQMTNLPSYVDVYLEIVNEREAKQLAQIAARPDLGGPTGRAAKEFVERHARRHTARVFFQNRQGYKAR